MNVRFFGGTRQQYDSLPTPRNPLGLYFCQDTNELFWGDQLISDGMRVVPTKADLPEPTKAADGVVYYVTETRNGYVVPHGTNKWLQTIYAPAIDATKVPESEIYNTVTTVGAVRDIAAEIYGEIDDLDARIANIEVGTSGSGVKSIYFAGVKLDELNGVFTIDRLCALRALGFSIPEDSETIEFVTKEYVDEQIKAITGVDLSEYAKKTDLEGLATKEFVLSKIPAITNSPTYTIKRQVAADAVLYALCKDGTAVEETIEVPNAYDDTNLLTQIASIEKALNNLTGGSDESIQQIVADALSDLPSATTTTPGLVKASEDIEVDADGSMRISANAFSTDRLVQGNDTLVLRSGSASI